MAVDQYVIAIKREARASAPKNWIEIISAVEGTELLGAGPKRMQMRATPEAFKTVRELVGAFCYIEKMIIHKPLLKSTLIIKNLIN